MTKVNIEIIQTKTETFPKLMIREKEKLDLGSSGNILVNLKQFTHCSTHSLHCWSQNSTLDRTYNHSNVIWKLETVRRPRN